MTQALKFAAAGKSFGGLNTLLLAHMNGTDASTTFTDEVGNTITPFGNAQIDTAQSQFGGASGLFDGTGDYLTVSGNWAPESVWNVEFWFKPVDFSALRVMAQHRPAVVTAGAYRFLANTAGQINFAAWNAAASAVVNLTSTGVLSTSSFNHCAITKDGNDWYLALNETIEATVTADIGTIAHDSTLYIATDEVAGGRDINGWLDEFRITEGEALYTANYTAPSSEFTL